MSEILVVVVVLVVGFAVVVVVVCPLGALVVVVVVPSIQHAYKVTSLPTEYVDLLPVVQVLVLPQPVKVLPS